MARYLGIHQSTAVARLEAAGVRILATEDPGNAEIRATLLGDFDRDRDTVTVPAAAPADWFEGMGAWHINAVNECHEVLSGEGIVEFMTPDGPIAVLIGVGDTMAVERVEHRYRALTSQEWVLRFAGEDLTPTNTGRPNDPWPEA